MTRARRPGSFKDPQHPFRIAIVCAMWLTGFDVESLATLYIDKPMKAHTLMQAIARANRIYPGKDCGVIVDYNGMLKSLRQALAQYALGDEEEEDREGEEIVKPIAELVAALRDAIELTEEHLRAHGFDTDQRRDTADVTEVLKELHRIVNAAIRAAAPGDDHSEELAVDLSQIDFAKLRDEFATKVNRKHAALRDSRHVVEKKLAQMLARTTRCAWTTTRSTRRSSPTTTGRRTGC